MSGNVRYIAVIVMGGLLLAACSSSKPSPADIQPVYRIRNAPLPVPDPKWNPRRGKAAVVSRPAPKVVKASTRTSLPVQASTKTVTIRKGDTLYAVSREYGVPVRSLISVNRLSAPYTLTVGQKLRIPMSNTHIVRKGETGYSISRMYGVTVSSLMEINTIRPPYNLSVGQKLILPGGASGTVQKKATNPKGRVTAIAAPPPRSKEGFIWPIKGQLASRFGPRESGVHNDGVNILAKSGTPVKAAESGVVVYASNALEGYGNLLLLKHEGGWITAYAHNERLLVRKGQKVKQGEVIARVGSTGGVTTPQLHFELRKGRQALDPLNYLKN